MDSKSKKDDDYDQEGRETRGSALQWKRMLMLIIAITMHNIPEGMAVGVGFGAASSADVSDRDALCKYHQDEENSCALISGQPRTPDQAFSIITGNKFCFSQEPCYRDRLAEFP